MYRNTNLFEPGRAKCERSFMQNVAKLNLRFDNRKNQDFRDIHLTFGVGWGSVLLIMGDTKVLAQVTCEISAPLGGRPTEGKLYLNADINGTSFLNESHQLGERRSLQLNTLLERTFRSSRCLDVESMCVVAEQYVWSVRVDVTVLNHDGNLYDACTTATLAALMHFRRPEVTFKDGVLRIYTENERDFVPLLFLHYPVSVTYCVYKSSPQPFVDPTLLEENTADTIIVLSFNSYKELCSLVAGGKTPTNARMIMQCAHNAARRSKEILTFIRKALALDDERRQAGHTAGYLDLLNKSAPKLTFNTLMADELALAIENCSMQSSAEQREPTTAVPAQQEKQQQKIEPKPTATPKDDTSWLPAAEKSKPKVKQLPAKAKARNKPNKAGKASQGRPADSDSEEETKPVI